MKKHALRVPLGTFALGLILTACGSTSSSTPDDAPAIACTQALTDFCGTDPSTCAHAGNPTLPTHIDPSSAGTSICNVCGATCSFGIETCGDGTVDIVIQTGMNTTVGTQLLHYKYSADALDLFSVVESTSGVPPYKPTTACLAGPSTVPTPGMCSDNSFWTCGT